MSFLAPLFFVALAAVAVPIFVHLIQRERKDIIEFPSLMFIRRIPYQSVERRRIHNWPLLLMRIAAMALVVAAFSRPFFATEAATAAITASGDREVVILLDRSASMAYGDHWTRAQDEARRLINGLGGRDRATLVLFDRGVEETVRATTNRGELELAVRQASVTAEATRFAPALREAESLLGRSDRQKREAYLISDFQKSGWERQEEIHLPQGATLTPIAVGSDTANLSVSSLAIQRATFSSEERATIAVGLVNRSGSAVTNQPVQLEIDGRVVGTRNITIAPRASGSVTFDPVTVAEANMRGVIRAGSDAFARDNEFYFVLSPSRTVSVLVVHADGAPADSRYLRVGLTSSRTPPFTVDVVPASRLGAADLEGRSVVVLNDVMLPTPAADLLAKFVGQGGGLFLVLGGRTPAATAWPVLPGTLAAPVDRTGFRGGSLGSPDYSHPIFEQFKDPRSGSFANVRFFRYRRLAVGPEDVVLARFDDGAAALVERRSGSGRVVAFTSTLDGDWNDFPRHAMFLPVLHESIKYLARYGELAAWETVGRMLDITAPISSIVREGQASRIAGTGRTGVVVSPAGEQTTLGGSGAPAIELREQGFYSVRLAGTGDRRPYTVAVNLDSAESDLTSLPPTDITAALGAASTAAAGQSFDRPAPTPVDLEKRQSLWWFLLVGGLALLLVEAALSNWQSKGAGKVLG